MCLYNQVKVAGNDGKYYNEWNFLIVKAQYVLTSLIQLLMILQTLYAFSKTSFHNKEVNCTQPSNSVSVPCLGKTLSLIHPLCQWWSKCL